MSTYKAYTDGALSVGFDFDFDREEAALVVIKITKESFEVLNEFHDAEAELMFQTLTDGRGINPKTFFNKIKFLKTEFGSGLECTITAWDQALESHNQIGEDKNVLKTLAWCQAQWEVYRMAIKHFYGVEYHFTRTDEYYGLCTEDESDWLMKVERNSVNQKDLTIRNETDIENAVKAIITGIDRHLQVSTGTFSSQKVTRRGIKIDGVEYWDDDFVLHNIGKTVITETDAFFIRVYNESGTPLHIFAR